MQNTTTSRLNYGDTRGNSGTGSLFRPIVAIIRDNKLTAPVIIALSTLQSVDFSQELNVQGFLEVHGVACTLRLLAQRPTPQVTSTALELLLRVCRFDDAVTAFADAHGASAVAPFLTGPPAVAAVAAALLAATSRTCAPDLLTPGEGTSHIAKIITAATRPNFARTQPGLATTEGAARTLAEVAWASKKARATIATPTNMTALMKTLTVATHAAQGKDASPVFEAPTSAATDGAPVLGLHPAGTVSAILALLGALSLDEDIDFEQMVSVAPVIAAMKVVTPYTPSADDNGDPVPAPAPGAASDAPASIAAVNGGTAGPYWRAVAPTGAPAAAMVIQRLAARPAAAPALVRAGAAAEIAALLARPLPDGAAVRALDAYFMLAQCMQPECVPALAAAAPRLAVFARAGHPAVATAALASTWALAQTDAGRTASRQAGLLAIALDRACPLAPALAAPPTTTPVFVPSDVLDTPPATPPATALAWASRALAAISLDPDSTRTLSTAEATRRLWTLVSSPDPATAAAAATALVGPARLPGAAARVARELVSGLETVATLLTNDDVVAAAGGARLTAAIATDEAATAALSEYGAVAKLAALLERPFCAELAADTARAICAICRLGANRAELTELGVAEGLVKYLKHADKIEKRAKAADEALLLHNTPAAAPADGTSKHRGATVRGGVYSVPEAHVDVNVIRETVTECIAELAELPAAALRFRAAGAAQLLVPLVGSRREALQRAAAGAVGLIRRHFIAATAGKA